MKRTLNKAKAYCIPMPQAHIILRQTPFGPYLLGHMQVMQNRPAGPCIAGQQDPAPRDLQKLCQTLITCQQQKRTTTVGKCKIPSRPTHCQEVLYITTQDNGLPGKITQLGSELRIYIVTPLTSATYKCSRRPLKSPDYTSSLIPGPSIKEKDIPHLFCDHSSTWCHASKES